jgi:hypothetical protein
MGMLTTTFHGAASARRGAAGRKGIAAALGVSALIGGAWFAGTNSAQATEPTPPRTIYGDPNPVPPPVPPTVPGGGPGTDPGQAPHLGTVSFEVPMPGGSAAGWGKAWDQCRGQYPETRSVVMLSGVASTARPDVEFQTWACRDTP